MVNRIKRTFYISSALLLFWACGGEERDTAIPGEEILSIQEMADVLTDLTLMESAIHMGSIAPGTMDKTDTSAKFNIYRQHGIPREKYEASLSYYSNHPEEFKEVYVIVLEKLTRLQKGEK